MKYLSLLGVTLPLLVAFLGKTLLSQLQVGSVCQALAWPGDRPPCPALRSVPLAGNSGLSFSASSSQSAPLQSVCAPQAPEDKANSLLASLEAPPTQLVSVKETSVLLTAGEGGACTAH